MADRVITHAQGEAIIAALQEIARGGGGGGATYTLTQDAQDGHTITLSGSNGYTVTITIPDKDTTYTPAVAGGAAGLMTGADKSKLDGIEAGAQVNPAPASDAPLMDGTAAVGTSTKYAREDHRHPTDTSRASTDPATASAAGLMSAGDKAKLDGVSFPVTVSGTSVSFSSDAAGRPVEVTAHIEVVQAAGTPSPENPIPITGWTAAAVTRTDGSGDSAQTVTVSFGEAGTVYGGTLDVARGLLTVTLRQFVIDGVNKSASSYNSVSAYSYCIVYTPIKGVNSTADNLWCDTFALAKSESERAPWKLYLVGNGDALVLLFPLNYFDNVSAANSWFSEHNTTVVYTLRTPITYQLTPAQITTLTGVNTVYADCGSVDVTHWPGTGVPGQAAPTMEQFSALVARVTALEGGG